MKISWCHRAADRDLELDLCPFKRIILPFIKPREVMHN